MHNGSPAPGTPRLARRSGAGWWLALFLALALPFPAAAQQVVSAPEKVILVAKGQTALLVQPVALQRLSIADPEVAEIFAVSPREIMVNGKKLGSTSLMLWDVGGRYRLYTVEVTPDVKVLEEQLRTLFPDERVSVSTTGNNVVLSGEVSTSGAAKRIVEAAQGAGATVVNNLSAPAPPQILLQVRFAEVSRSAVEEVGTQISALRFQGGVGGGGQTRVETLSDGLLRLFLLDGGTQIEAVIRALRSRGLFKTLAEPNLLAVEGEEASFLAGGEFPFPVLQNSQSDAVTVVWKEFGVRLRFRPVITPAGAIRLRIAPEVSSLDFSTGLRVGGFQIPSLLTRRTETEVELRDGQYLAIAGLLNNSIRENVTRIPYLGDIPVLGALFRSRDARHDRTELLVIVTPRLVQPTGTPPALPTGEPETWRWDPSLRQPAQQSRPPR
jgi:pilus assembly protein CpaC